MDLNSGPVPGATLGWSGNPRSSEASAGAVGRVEPRGSDVKVGISGKYPPPTEPFLSFGEASNGDC